ncbi:hypothetical protein SAMN05720473_102262 [Fibrobacter sp. UWB15]|uniref:hypothetical protein n=1 Tax=unclassified Fibrobacter TaxID=2634177 RepID=UPI000917CAF2|nr:MULTISPECIES: hypothetical protein [unclassified Fibrobacter]PWJ66524.1 hypothetical protein BGW99_102262 [Fibrobacter sp. UWB6]SHG01380.1 hypothetical protein SAMN05720760_10330 [Fibrobacter sp. UWB8]SMG22536.1 hypothetical protein SAMN05720473_102262 [Fibrobacter sp. UWB15]
MMLTKKIALTSAILFSAATAFAEGESVEAQQTSLLQKLDSLSASVLGLKFNGTVKAGGLTSMAKSDQFSDKSPTQENQAYTDANLVLTAHPSAETRATIQLRLHKDWQNAYDENNNPVIGHWFSYDGSILNKHLDFNLGYMRVGYTPYTLYTPQQKLLQEPEIFAEKRVEALAQRNLDTTSRRLMQGLNADFHSGNVGPMSDIHAQVTGARMRDAAKKTDQVFFDFDWTDRYFYGLRLGADAYGAHLGVNYTDVFDRVKSRRSRKISTNDTVYYEDNSVLSIEAGFDSKELLKNSSFGFGLNGEFAMSSLESSRDYIKNEKKQFYELNEFMVVLDPALTNRRDTSFVYVKVNETTEATDFNEDLGTVDGNAFYVEPFATIDLAGIEGTLKVMYLQNDEKFWSEMASSPVYRGGATVLNANALYGDNSAASLIDNFGMSSLENMYMTVYNSNPLYAGNLMTSNSKNAITDQAESGNMYFRLYNNYKNAHFYRNGYNADVKKAREIQAELLYLDPANDMALPFGVATGDRKGLNVNLDLSWNDAVELNALFGMISTVNSDIEEVKFTRYAAGLGVDFGRLFGLDRKIKLQGSYDHTEEDKGFQRKNDRIMAGANIDVIGPVALLAGYQMSTREFGVPLFVSNLASVNKAEESMLLVGPKIKIAPHSYLSVQYGLLTDKISYVSASAMLDETGAPVLDPLTGEAALQMNPAELAIDKSVIIADVTVNF